ncbi:MAG TPA: F0F1 ATP synthase subunit delta [Pyrinomonadaceae bacterium]|nr:F0F1 ATP synthase subunit delta [Pyrinomonadaceae bacterium]
MRSISRRSQLASLRRLKTRLESERARRSAKVESEGTLSGNLKARLRADLIRIYGPLRVSFVEMPALAGGMRITVGSDLYYGSVRGTLAALEEKVGH